MSTAVAERGASVAEVPPLARRVVSGIGAPGGPRMAEELLAGVDIKPGDRVVHLAPSPTGAPESALDAGPTEYTVVDPDPLTCRLLSRSLRGAGRECRIESPQATGLPVACATVVLAEGVLSSAPGAARERMLAEAARLLRPRGRLALHEVALAADADAGPPGLAHLTAGAWRALVEDAGLLVVGTVAGPTDPPEPARAMRQVRSRAALRLAREVARESRPGAPAAVLREGLSDPRLNALVVLAEKPLIKGMRWPGA